jgi:hypothetical protein
MTVEFVLRPSKDFLRVLLFTYLNNYYLIKSSACGVKFLTVLHCTTVS